MQVAFSPCPNDTFLFHAWVHGLVGDRIDPNYADIRELNRSARRGDYPICKVSFYCLGHILDEYVMLPTGAALGHGCGPKVIAKEPFPLEQLSQKIVAIPGEHTTAHLLLQLLAPQPAGKVFCRYHEVESASDCALIIHEQRFTFQERGWCEIADLGDLWETTYGVPIPLGGIVAKRALGKRAIQRIVGSLQASLHQAKTETPFDYILAHSIEKDPLIIRQHIDTYVTDETDSISGRGIAGVETLLSEARKRNLIPSQETQWLF